MNDQHPHAGYVTDATQTTGSFAVDPLFGTYDAGYDAGQAGYADYSAQSDQHGYSGYTDYSSQWDTGSHGSYTATGQWDATAWTEAQQTGQYEAAAFASYDTTGQWTTPGFETGTYDATAWNQGAAPEPLVPQQFTAENHPETVAYDTATYETGAYENSAYDTTGTYDATGTYDTSAAYDATTAYDANPAYETTAVYDTAAYGQEQQAQQERDRLEAFHGAETMVALQLDPDLDPDLAGGLDTDLDTSVDVTPEAVPAAPGARAVRRSGGGSRGRRRTPAKRSALLTVAVPSACVMGVAGIAAASVSGLTDSGADGKDDTTTLAAADPASVKQVAANSKLDTQLAALSADARDFGDRASRTQERIDLKLRQEAEKKKREEEAARKEALRPKFWLPVKLHQLSARYGQSGVNWMSVHTGIDFPVQYGTPVMAATDGTVRTQWNSAYGNMAIVTSPDGTETWYCHLSSTKIRSGKVKAGDVIAYSGNSGNSTGPHLHFEVRPNGGAAIDPLSWLRSHGLDPTS
ncbi:M23 family metallopeptidase [Streptomyces roseoviridis]|uniref:Peptidoglycan DD-metalloendopeptidase family protein n=1 Tax=Streptomyces roseoviridis TaxID=67361 RepID=A0ABV5QJR0_9ACTN